jgi:hypothetical protein
MQNSQLAQSSIVIANCPFYIIPFLFQLAEMRDLDKTRKIWLSYRVFINMIIDYISKANFALFHRKNVIDLIVRFGVVAQIFSTRSYACVTQ